MPKPKPTRAELLSRLKRSAVKRGLEAGSHPYNSYVFGTLKKADSSGMFSTSASQSDRNRVLAIDRRTQSERRES